MEKMRHVFSNLVPASKGSSEPRPVCPGTHILNCNLKPKVAETPWHPGESLTRVHQTLDSVFPKPNQDPVYKNISLSSCYNSWSSGVDCGLLGRHCRNIQNRPRILFVSRTDGLSCVGTGAEGAGLQRPRLRDWYVPAGSPLTPAGSC